MLGILTPFQKLLQTPTNDTDVQLKPPLTVNSFESIPNDFYTSVLNFNASMSLKHCASNKLFL